jgi:hypothetical protein
MRCLYSIILTVFICVPVAAQIYADDTLFIGNPECSPFHVPYQGIVNMPVWMNPYGVGGGTVSLITLNFAVSERLGGNFYYPWTYEFSDPVYFPDGRTQALSFAPDSPSDSMVHLADFTFRMDIDSSFIGDTLQIMNAINTFSDTTGTVVIIYDVLISEIVVDALTSIEGGQNLPGIISLRQNYPNPFNSSTTIEFDLPWTMYVRIDIYDILGRRIETPVDEVREAGSHRVVWDASNYSSGMYFYRLEAGEYVRIRKMMYLK